MQGQPDVQALAEGNDLPQEGLQRAPEGFLAHPARPGLLRALHVRLVKAGHRGPAPGGDGRAAAEPADHRHPVVADGADVQLGAVDQQLLEALQLLLRAGQAQLHLVQGRGALDDGQLQALVRVGLLEQAQVLQRLGRQGLVHLPRAGNDVLEAHLLFQVHLGLVKAAEIGKSQLHVRLIRPSRWPLQGAPGNNRALPWHGFSISSSGPASSCPAGGRGNPRTARPCARSPGCRSRP